MYPLREPNRRYSQMTGRRYALLFAGLLLLAAAWKAVFIVWDVIPFNADEAVVALMARHILRGALPVFFYGQAYMGSLDAFLVAAGFAVFGEHVWVIRLVQTALYLGVIASTVVLGEALFGSRAHALLAGLLLAVPAVNVLLYTTASLGGYGEALLIGNFILLSGWKAVGSLEAQTDRLPVGWITGWAALVGLGVWTHGLTLVYSASSGILLLWTLMSQRALARQRKRVGGLLLLAAVGFVLGALPWFAFAAGNGVDWLVQELFGSAIAVESAPWYQRAGLHLVYFFLFAPTVVFGFRPPWSVDWLAVPLIPLVLVVWIGVLYVWLRGLRQPGPYRRGFALLGGVALVLILAFVFTSFGADVSGRYFLPLAVPLALVAGQAARRFEGTRLGVALAVALLLAYHAAGTIQSALRYPPGITTQFYAPTIVDHRYDAALIAFLHEHGETRGYTNYWVAYPLAFHSQEQLIFVPHLPYHLDFRYTPRDDRYAPYRDMVANSERVAYITARHPALDALLRDEFARLDITWQEQQIGDYRVFFALSRAVRPPELGLGLPR